MTWVNQLVQFNQNFDFKTRKDGSWKKILWAPRLSMIESVDNMNLYILGYISKIDGKTNSCHKGLIKFVQYYHITFF